MDYEEADRNAYEKIVKPMQNAEYGVGDEVTVEFDDEGETDTLTGTITGFHNHSESAEPGFWLKYTVALSDGEHTYISWWPLTAIVAHIDSSERES